MTSSAKDPDERNIIPGYINQLTSTVNIMKNSPMDIKVVQSDLKAKVLLNVLLLT